MAYGSKYYDYQVVFIFLILIVAILILTAFLVALYYVSQANVKNKKAGTNGPRTRTPNSLPATRTNWQAAPQPSQQLPTPYSPTDLERGITQTQEYSYDPRLVSTQPGYMQQPLVQNYTGNEYPGAKVRELQPEYVYQQVRDGPVTWTSNQQVHDVAYPISPVQQVQATSASAYHMSSV
ncbi:hypothetical protein M3Y94_00435700 [Aphelenchoides besseyi]|nr:hypothetical protein M3Y94_00435700 [Aphelenchoides besseyi]